MSKRTRRNHAPAFQAKVPFAGYPDLLRRPGALARSAQLVDGAAEVFGSEPKAGLAAPAIDVKTLHAKIDELTLTNDQRP